MVASQRRNLMTPAAVILRIAVEQKDRFAGAYVCITNAKPIDDHRFEVRVAGGWTPPSTAACDTFTAHLLASPLARTSGERA